MASIQQIRNESEGRMQSSMEQLHASHRRRIERAIVEHGSVEAIPLSFWQQLQREIEEEAAGLLLLVIIASTQSTENQLRVDIGQAERQRIADTFARRRAQQLSAEYVANTREALARRFETPVETLEDMRQRVGEVLSPARAQRLAVTETTEGISAGQNGAADEAVNQDATLIINKLWRTERDARVCPICAPLDNTPSRLWGRQFPTGPPAHVNCRCELILQPERQQVAA